MAIGATTATGLFCCFLSSSNFFCASSVGVFTTGCGVVTTVVIGFAGGDVITATGGVGVTLFCCFLSSSNFFCKSSVWGFVVFTGWFEVTGFVGVCVTTGDVGFVSCFTGTCVFNQ